MTEYRKPGPRRSHPGRGGFKPTDEQRAEVEILAAARWPEVDIARRIGIAHETLRKHFVEELRTGAARRNADVVIAQYNAAMAGKVSAQEKWLKRAEVTPEFLPDRESRGVAQEKLGKKAAAQQAAENPDISTEMGSRMAKRVAEALH